MLEVQCVKLTAQDCKHQRQLLKSTETRTSHLWVQIYWPRWFHYCEKVNYRLFKQFWPLWTLHLHLEEAVWQCVSPPSTPHPHWRCHSWRCPLCSTPPPALVHPESLVLPDFGFYKLERKRSTSSEPVKRPKYHSCVTSDHPEWCRFINLLNKIGSVFFGL